MDFEQISREALNNVKKFIPSSKKEIDSFDLKYGDKCKVLIIDHCPFTLMSNTHTTIACVVNKNDDASSNFTFSFSYNDSYGVECNCKLEDAFIIKKIDGK